MGNLTQPAFNILITNIKSHANVQHHILELAMCVDYLATYVKSVQIGLIISKVHNHIYEANIFPLLSSNIPPNISSHIFTPNRPPVLTQQLTADYVMSQHAWDEIMTMLNEMAEEDRLIKQTFHKTYNSAAGVLGKAKNKTLAASPNDSTNTCKQPDQGSKSVRFNSRDQDTKSPTTPA